MGPCYQTHSRFRAQVVKSLPSVSGRTNGLLLKGESVHWTDPFLQIPYGSSSVLHQEKRWLALVGPGLLCIQFYDGQEQIPSSTDL